MRFSSSKSGRREDGPQI